MPSARILSANRSAKSYVLVGRFFLPHYAVLPEINEALFAFDQSLLGG